MTVEITEPGVYSIPPHTYHQDPVRGGSLSSTVARMLVKPGGPARYAGGERRQSPAFDFGSLAHLKLLGVGERIRVIDADNYRTIAARELRDAAYDYGEVPVLTGSGDLEKADEMVAALDDESRDLLNQPGAPEQMVAWQDRDNVWCRALVDYLPDDPAGVVVDYKTARSVDPTDLGAAVLRHGYHQQADWYLRGLRAVGRATTATRLLLVVQEKERPYLSIPVEPLADPDVARVAELLNDEALATWRRCRESDEWPGVVHDPSKPLPIPAWWWSLYDDLLLGSGEIGASS